MNRLHLQLEHLGQENTLRDARAAFQAEISYPGGAGPDSSIPAQWREAFNMFKKVVENKRK